MSRRASGLRAAAKVLVSLALIAYLLHRIGIRAVLREAVLQRPVFLLPAALGLLLSLYVNALPFLWIGRRFGLHLRDALAGSVRAWAWGLITPGRLGEFSVIHYLGKHGVPSGESALVSLLIRGMSILILVFLGCLCLWWFRLPRAGLSLGLALTLLLAGIWAHHRRLALLARFRRLLPSGLRHHLNLDTSFVRDGRLVLAIALAQVIRILLLFSISTSLFLAVGATLGFGQVVLVNSVARLVSMVPISFNGLGLREGVQVTLFDHWFGVGPATVLSMGLWMNALTYGLAAGVWARSLLSGKARSAPHSS